MLINGKNVSDQYFICKVTLFWKIELGGHQKEVMESLVLVREANFRIGSGQVTEEVGLPSAVPGHLVFNHPPATLNGIGIGSGDRIHKV